MTRMGKSIRHKWVKIELIPSRVFSNGVLVVPFLNGEALYNCKERPYLKNRFLIKNKRFLP